MAPSVEHGRCVFGVIKETNCFALKFNLDIIQDQNGSVFVMHEHVSNENDIVEALRRNAFT